MRYCVRFITDGAAHSVDSNELAFKLAAKGAFRQVRGGGGGGGGGGSV